MKMLVVVVIVKKAGFISYPMDPECHVAGYLSYFVLARVAEPVLSIVEA